MAAARTALGDAAFDAAWSLGRAVSLDEVIAEALAVAEAPTAQQGTPIAVPSPVSQPA